jgi:hypothetical protein
MNEMTNLAQLTPIPIKDLLKSNTEGRNWLLDNTNQLENLLGMELSNPGVCLNTPEEARPDIIAEENMAEKKVVCLINLDVPTDKDFKRFLSASTAHNASITLWIVSEVDEQTKAIIQWLNHRTEWKTQFVIAKIEGYTIGDSLPVIHLTKI